MINYTPSSLNFHINWNLKREPVFRLLDNITWLNNFFETGEIMLSCFNNFKKNPDEMQGDNREGKAMIGGYDEKNKKSNHLIYEAGLNAYIMFSTNELTDNVKNDFNAKCAIQINHPTLFALEISKKLPFVNSGLEGNCNYASSRSLYFKNKIDKFNEMEFSNNHNSHQIINELNMGMELFLKLDKYKHQQEYRFIWFSQETINNSIIIKCPEAIQYCEKIVFSNE